MPQQLIYTSAPRGIVAGRSGHCTVARSATMREALMLQLEKFCYYQHLSLSGGQERPIFTCRIVDIRGSRFHVLSRIQDSGLDFTGRTNFIAHHLVFTPEEIGRFPTSAVILRDWTGWVRSWTNEPQLLENEDWSGLAALASTTNVPAQTWQRVTGDAVNAYGLLDARVGASFRVDDQTEETVLELIAESLELLEMRDAGNDFRSASWKYTFTTSMQEQDNPSDFRWRCIHSDNPAANRFATPDCRALSAVRATKWTGEETAFARTGRQPPRFLVEPHDIRITEGEAARFTAKAEGVPNPTYQWFSVGRAHSEQVLPGETNSELVVSNPALGVSRYIVSAINSAAKIQSKVATLSVERKLTLSQVSVGTGSGGPNRAALYNVKSGEDIDRQRRRLESESARKIFQKRQKRKKILVTALAAILILVAGVLSWKFAPRRLAEKSPNEASRKADSSRLPTATVPATSPRYQSDPSSATAQQAETGVMQSDPNTKKGLPSDLPQPTQYNLPDGWTRTLIGNVSNPNADFVSPRFDISGAAEGFLTNGDNVLFVSTTYGSNNFQASLLISELASSASRCGIMMRESGRPNAPFLFIGASSEKVHVYCRDSNGKFISNEHEIPKLKRNSAMFLRFQQMENHIVPLYSFDAKNWLSNVTSAISGDTRSLVGLAICSGNPSNKVVAHFGGVINLKK
jgi:hypothetical protein